MQNILFTITSPIADQPGIITSRNTFSVLDCRESKFSSLALNQQVHFWAHHENREIILLNLHSPILNRDLVSGYWLFDLIGKYFLSEKISIFESE